MIKRTIISAMLLLAFQTGFSQAKLKINFPQKEENISPLVKEKVEKYSLEINEIVKEEKKEMEAELQEITAQQKAGNLSEEEANQQKKAIAQRYSEKIDRRIEKLGFDI
ncbi:MAG: PorT family protein, partial [Bergeyella zoohelcum]|nr:PorT family protein [Bergeyella zoohelcum]